MIRNNVEFVNAKVAGHVTAISNRIKHRAMHQFSASQVDYIYTMCICFIQLSKCRWRERLCQRTRTNWIVL